MTIIRTLIVSLLGLAVVLGGAQCQDHTLLHEQLRFSAEQESVDRPVPLPKDVLQILQEDKDVAMIQESERESGNPPGAWFSASEVHLDGPGETDLVVMGIGRLRGANVNTFWVFRGTSQGHVLVLTVPAHDLEITNRRGNGYREIRAVAMTAVRVYTNLYRFDGKQYQAYQKKSTALP